MVVKAEAQHPISGLEGAFEPDEMAYNGLSLVVGAQRMLAEGLEPDNEESEAFQEEYRRLVETDTEFQESLTALQLTAPALHRAAIETSKAYQKALDIKEQIKLQAQEADRSEDGPSEIDYGPVRPLPGGGAQIRPSKLG
jgi:hypothetical protein